MEIIQKDIVVSCYGGWFESGHEYGVRDKEFLDKGLYDILNFLLIYVRKE